jgi:CBS domain containing-hemolysin-like protein
MTPRTPVTALREGQTAHEALLATCDSSHSHFPLLDRSGDSLLGVVYAAGRGLSVCGRG